MTRRKPLLALLFILAIGASYGLPHLLEAPTKAGCVRPEEAVGRFLEAVDRGELTLFTAVLHRDDIVPTRVEFLYQLGSSLPTTIVHADLKQPMPVPAQPRLEIRAVSAELDFGGSIIETKAHVYARPDKGGKTTP